MMESRRKQIGGGEIFSFFILTVLTVSDEKGLDQPACQEEWKKCKRGEE
jgi:hypothetical protein